MALVCLGSIAGAPGVTTLSVLTAASWPRPAVLLEADPSGGVLAIRYRLGRSPGLAGLAAVVRQGAPADAAWQHSQMLPGDLPVVVAPESGPVTTGILDDAGHALARWCRDHAELDVIVDCGRLAVRDVTWPLWAAANEMLLVTRPRADELYPVVHRFKALDRHVRSLGLVLVGDRPYRPEEVALQLGLPIRGVVSDDARAASVLARGGSGRTLRRSALVRSVRSLVDSLALRLGLPVVAAEEVALPGAVTEITAAPEDRPPRRRRRREPRARPPALPAPSPAPPVPPPPPPPSPRPGERPAGPEPGAPEPARPVATPLPAAPPPTPAAPPLERSSRAPQPTAPVRGPLVGEAGPQAAAPAGGRARTGAEVAPPAAGGRSDLASIVAAADKLGSRAEERARQTKPEAEEQSASEVAPDSSDESASEAEPDSSSEPKAEAVVESSPPAEPEPVVEPDSESGASSESELPVQQTGHSLPLVFARPEEVMVGMLERTAEVLSEEASNDAVVPVAGPAYPAADTAAAPNGVWTVDLTGHADRPTVNGEAIITDDRPPLPQRRTLTLAESSAEGVTGPPGPPASPRSLRPEEVPHSGEGELASVGAGSVPVPTAYPGPEADPHPKPKPAAPAAAVGGAVSPGPGAAVSSGSTPEPDGSSGSGGRGDG